MADQAMSPDELREAIAGGYLVAGSIFRFMIDVLEERYGLEVATAIGTEVVRRKAQAVGERAVAKAGRGGLEAMAAADRSGFPSIEVLEISPTRYVVRDSHCPIVEGWRAAGLSEERIRRLADIYCWGDLYSAQVFDRRIKLEFRGRLAEGKPYCQWVFTLDLD